MRKVEERQRQTDTHAEGKSVISIRKTNCLTFVTLIFLHTATKKGFFFKSSTNHKYFCPNKIITAIKLLNSACFWYFLCKNFIFGARDHRVPSRLPEQGPAMPKFCQSLSFGYKEIKFIFRSLTKTFFETFYSFRLSGMF